MFNRRTFLLGLGTGIIIGAVLLQLFNLGMNSQENLKKIGRQLENPGIEQGDAAEAPEQTDSAAADQGLQPTPDDGAQPEPSPQSPADSPSADATQNEDAAEPSPKTEEAASGALRLIRIEHGMSLSKVAAILTAEQILNTSGAEVFTRKMEADNKLARAGYYAMPERSEPEAVIAAVTSQPLSKEEAEKRVAEQQQ